jgi:hypothetical protein
MAFPPLDGGSRWKTLDDVDLVLVATADSRANPQNVDVYLLPASEVQKRFRAAYEARLKHGHAVRDNYGMWVMLDKGDDQVPNQVGHSLAVDYPAIARFSLDELEARSAGQAVEAEPADEQVLPTFGTVAEVLEFARERIASLTGMPADAIKLDLRMGV